MVDQQFHECDDDRDPHHDRDPTGERPAGRSHGDGEVRHQDVKVRGHQLGGELLQGQQPRGARSEGIGQDQGADHPSQGGHQGAGADDERAGAGGAARGTHLETRSRQKQYDQA